MASQVVQHVDPIILTDDIIQLARGWASDCIARQPHFRGPQKDLVAQHTIISPVHGRECSLALFLSAALPHHANAYISPPGSKTENGELVGPPDHFSIFIYHQAGFSRRMLLAAILHELTHVVDPHFLEDCEIRKGASHTGQFKDPRQHYRLVSERRAFASMWIAEIHESLKWAEVTEEGAFDPIRFINRMAKMLPEFEGFVRCTDLHPELIRQISLIETAVRAKL